eukprot:1154654-Pelagomonas_calceolata.AAC.2
MAKHAYKQGAGKLAKRDLLDGIETTVIKESNVERPLHNLKPGHLYIFICKDLNLYKRHAVAYSSITFFGGLVDLQIVPLIKPDLYHKPITCAVRELPTSFKGKEISRRMGTKSRESPSPEGKREASVGQVGS